MHREASLCPLNVDNHCIAEDHSTYSAVSGKDSLKSKRILSSESFPLPVQEHGKKC